MKGGHDVPIPKIISRYFKSIRNCRIASKMADRTYIYDNSIEDAQAQLLYRMINGSIYKKYVEPIPEWAATII